MHCSTRVKRLTAGGGRGKEQSSEGLALLVRVLVAGPTISVMPATMLPQMRVPMEHRKGHEAIWHRFHRHRQDHHLEDDLGCAIRSIAS